MKAEELRIGNWYKQDINGGEYARITPIDIQELLDDPLEDYYKPIPLTEHILIMFGFDKSDENYCLNGYYASFEADCPLWIGQQGCCQYETISEGLKYVHQLQNLYFALTGEELQLNNKIK